MTTNSASVKLSEQTSLPRVMVVGLASCFGCQLQITNQEQFLQDIIGRFDLVYWQLVSSEPMPEDFDVVVIEGAVTTQAALDQLQELRKKAQTVITIGACAYSAGIPGIAANHFEKHSTAVYERLPEACRQPIAPRAVKDVIDVDYEVLSCPIDFYEFAAVLSHALGGSNRARRSTTMCNECKRQENMCFYPQGEICMGMVTTGGCRAKCPSLGRPCMGCRGLSVEANLESARQTVKLYNLDPLEFERKLTIFNQTNPTLSTDEVTHD